MKKGICNEQATTSLRYYEGDGNGIFYVFIQVTDDQHLSGETNFLSKWVHPELNFN